MKTDDLENELRNLKLTHLTESELTAYCDQQSDQIGRARMETHLNQCFICERRLALLQEERAALSNREITADEVALVERLMEQVGLAQKPPANKPAATPDAVSLQERLADYLRQLMASWRISFMREAVRGDQVQELWRWQSEDGKVQAHALLETNADLTIHLSSNEIGMEGTRLRFHLGLFNQEITLRRVSESEVAAKIAVPWQYRRGNLAELSIERL
jgi:hypothetical protein